MGSIGQVSCGKTVGKWPRKANTQTRHGQRAFPCYFSDFYRENDARISIRSLYLSLSGFRSIVRFERKGRKGREEKKFKRNRKHVFQHSAPNIRVYFILDSLQSMHQNLPIEKSIRIVPILMDRATLS